MTDDSLLLQFVYIVEDADCAKGVKILVIVNAMQKTEINVIGLESVQFPQERLFNCFKITAPAVFAVFVIDCTEMHLQENFISAILDCSTDGRVGCTRGAEVEEIDSVIYRLSYDRLNLVGRRCTYSAHTKTEYAEFFVFSAVW